MNSQPIKTALCSFGMSGKLFHAPFVEANKNFELYACLERSKKVITTYYPKVISYTTYEELLADEKIELVIVNTPNVTHYNFAKQALLAGKHVIVEKPFTPRTSEAKELIELAEKVGKKISVYHNRRYDSDYKTIKKILDENRIGEVVEAEFHFDRFVENLSPKVHKETPEMGTGALYDLGSHLIDQALQLFGIPTAVFADIDSMRPISLVDDYFEVLLYYPTKRVRIKGTYVAKEPIVGYVLHGAKGSFLKQKSNVQEEALLAGIVPNTENWGKENESQYGLLHNQDGKQIIPSLAGNYMDYFDDVFTSIRANDPMPVNAVEAMQVITIIEAAFKSSKERRVIDLI